MKGCELASLQPLIAPPSLQQCMLPRADRRKKSIFLQSGILGIDAGEDVISHTSADGINNIVCDYRHEVRNIVILSLTFLYEQSYANDTGSPTWEGAI